MLRIIQSKRKKRALSSYEHQWHSPPPWRSLCCRKTTSHQRGAQADLQALIWWSLVRGTVSTLEDGPVQLGSRPILIQWEIGHWRLFLHHWYTHQWHGKTRWTIPCLYFFHYELSVASARRRSYYKKYPKLRPQIRLKWHEDEAFELVTCHLHTRRQAQVELKNLARQRQRSWEICLICEDLLKHSDYSTAKKSEEKLMLKKYLMSKAIRNITSSLQNKKWLNIISFSAWLKFTF